MVSLWYAVGERTPKCNVPAWPYYFHDHPVIVGRAPYSSQNSFLILANNGGQSVVRFSERFLKLHVGEFNDFVAPDKVQFCERNSIVHAGEDQFSNEEIT